MVGEIIKHWITREELSFSKCQVCLSGAPSADRFRYDMCLKCHNYFLRWAFTLLENCGPGTFNLNVPRRLGARRTRILITLALILKMRCEDARKRKYTKDVLQYALAH